MSAGSGCLTAHHIPPPLTGHQLRARPHSLSVGALGKVHMNETNPPPTDPPPCKATNRHFQSSAHATFRQPGRPQSGTNQLKSTLQNSKQYSPVNDRPAHLPHLIHNIMGGQHLPTAAQTRALTALTTSMCQYVYTTNPPALLHYRTASELCHVNLPRTSTVDTIRVVNP